jgi:hypothetical protein
MQKKHVLSPGQTAYRYPVLRIRPGRILPFIVGSGFEATEIEIFLPYFVLKSYMNT